MCLSIYLSIYLCRCPENSVGGWATPRRSCRPGIGWSSLRTAIDFDSPFIIVTSACRLQLTCRFPYYLSLQLTASEKCETEQLASMQNGVTSCGWTPCLLGFVRCLSLPRAAGARKVPASPAVLRCLCFSACGLAETDLPSPFWGPTPSCAAAGSGTRRVIARAVPLALGAPGKARRRCRTHAHPLSPPEARRSGPGA